jgi:L-aspartate oxidase
MRQRFPGIDRLCRNFGLDFTRDLIPVCPGAHYMIGGVTIDLHGRTTLPGLWAAGEVTSSGLHGANRLASNSLLEGLVYGARAAEDIVAALDRAGPRELEVSPVSAPTVAENQNGIDLDDLRKSLRALMWRYMGITRDAPGLKEAADQVDRWARYILPLEFHDPSGWTMQNMLIVARLMIEAATKRQESRGVHFRRDFPLSDPALNHHIELRLLAALESQPTPKRLSGL